MKQGKTSRREKLFSMQIDVFKEWRKHKSGRETVRLRAGVKKFSKNMERVIESDSYNFLSEVRRKRKAIDRTGGWFGLSTNGVPSDEFNRFTREHAEFIGSSHNTTFRFNPRDEIA